MEFGVPIVNHLPDFEGRDRLYDTLEEGSRQIRLIGLLGSDARENPLRCLLVTTDLEAARDAYRYMALSYYWGDPKDTEIVLVQRSPSRDAAWFEVPVTRNLVAALTEIRARLSHNQAYSV